MSFPFDRNKFKRLVMVISYLCFMFMFVVRFDNYGNYGLLCGADGPAHLIVNRDRRPEALGRV